MYISFDNTFTKKSYHAILSQNQSIYPKLDTRISFVRPPPPPSRSGYPPWILKRAGLESSGQG